MSKGSGSEELRDLAGVKIRRRVYGEHITSTDVFKKYILPEIREMIYRYKWVDLFCGEGNLILPILELVPEDKRIEFFRRHIYCFDIQREMIEKAILNASRYGIPRDVAEKNIIQQDTIKSYPVYIFNDELPVYHITNPPYLYKGFIVKHREAWRYLEYFRGENEKYQDLYQLALINDLRHGVERMIYIIPSNFLYGYSVSNQIRKDLLKYYVIKKAIIFERQIFEHTGTNVMIAFFERKRYPGEEPIVFEGIKIDKDVRRRIYTLDPRYNYRAGYEFEDFVNNYRSRRPLKISFYLTLDEVKRNPGEKPLKVIDVNDFDGKEYKKKIIYVNEELYEKVRRNILFIRTLDTGSYEGRAGLYVIREVFGVDGILVSKAPYRTHPIQIFLTPQISAEEQLMLKEYFNLILEYFRELTDSGFMTTYKYSESEYTRKYLGLTQAKKLIETFPIFTLNKKEFTELKELIRKRDPVELIRFVQFSYHNRLKANKSLNF
jgi:hypothetical protein